MPRRETLEEARRRREVERLVTAVQSGDIDAIEDLTKEEVELLLTRANPGESLEDLLDRLRGPGNDRD